MAICATLLAVGVARTVPARCSLIDPAAAAARRGADEAVVDVRLEGEYRLDGHLEGSINVPAYDWQHGYYTPRPEFAAEVLEACGGGNSVVLVCRDGRLSTGALAALKADDASAQLTQVEVLDGGLDAWEEAELPGMVVDEDGEDGLVGAWV